MDQKIQFICTVYTGPRAPHSPDALDRPGALHIHHDLMPAEHARENNAIIIKVDNFVPKPGVSDYYFGVERRKAL